MAVVTLVVLLFGIWSISTATRNRDWASAALLVTLNVGVIVTWVLAERRRAKASRDDGEKTAEDE